MDLSNTRDYIRSAVLIPLCISSPKVQKFSISFSLPKHRSKTHTCTQRPFPPLGHQQPKDNCKRIQGVLLFPWDTGVHSFLQALKLFSECLCLKLWG